MRSSHSFGWSLPKWPCLALRTRCTNNTPVGLLIEHPTFLRLHCIWWCEWSKLQRIDSGRILKPRVFKSSFSLLAESRRPGFMCNKSWSCIPLPSLTIWLYLTHLFHQPASSKGHHLLLSLHGPPWTSSSASAVPDAKAAESELPHSSPGSSACCIRALGMHGPKHHSNGMQWREHPKDHQSSCLLVKSIFNSTSESSSASNSHWTGHLDIKTLLGLQARWYQAPRECQRHVYTWKSAWYWKRKDSTTPVQNYEEN